MWGFAKILTQLGFYGWSQGLLSRQLESIIAQVAILGLIIVLTCFVINAILKHVDRHARVYFFGQASLNAFFIWQWTINKWVIH